MSENENEKLLLDVREVQKILGFGITNTNTYKIIKEQKIPDIRIGRQIKVFKKGLYE